MMLHMKRIYDAPSPDDGKRIFVDRLWARGLSKEKAQLDAWEKELAPSAGLRKWYGHDPGKFEEFRTRYRAELDANPAAAAFAGEIAGDDGTATLLFGAKDADHSNAAVLKDWLEEHVARSKVPAAFHIRKADISELPAIMKIYAHARKFMAEHGNPNQWGKTNWPPEELVRQDIENGKCYACMDAGHLAGVFYYDYGADIEPSYRRIESGGWLKDTPYGVVHRIASDGTAKGVGSSCINWAFEQSGHLRIDTHPDNEVMQNLLVKLGFQRCGVIHVVEDDDPRFAYEKA